MKAKILSALALGFLVAACASADRIDDLVKSEMELLHIPGLSLEIKVGSRVIKRAGYGYADLEQKVRMKPESVLEIGSITKQFTSACVMLLQDRGQLKIDDPIGKYLPELPEAWKVLPIRRLLNHSSGLKDYLVSSGLNQTGYKSEMELINPIAKLPLDFTTGEGWQYSNTGYLLAGMLVQRVSGKSLGDFMHDNLFVPLRIKSMTTTTPETIFENRARGYAFNGKKFTNIAATNPSLGAGAGFLMGSVDDLVAWSEGLEPQKFLSRQALDELVALVRFNDGTNGDYGLGHFLFWDKGIEVVAHGGNTIGFSANLMRVPSKHISIAILTNAAGLSPQQLARHILATIEPSMDLGSRKPGKESKPELTTKFKAWVAEAAKGKLDKTIFAPSFAVQFKTIRGMAIPMAFTALGKRAKSITFIDEDVRGDDRWCRYRIELDEGQAYLQLHWTKDNQISYFDNLYVNFKKPKETPKPSAPNTSKPGA